MNLKKLVEDLQEIADETIDETTKEHLGDIIDELKLSTNYNKS